MTHHVIHGDCIVGMQLLDDNSIDAVVTDPPYGISFLGCAWDGADIEARTAARRSAPSRDPKSSPLGGHNSIAAEAGKYDLTPRGMAAFEQFSRDWAREALRVLKPGGHLLSFASPRTHHRMACGIEDAGFEIRDMLGWVFGSGFPKSLNLEGGLGTALKPAHEPITLARKPLAGTVAATVKAYGTGALNIDAARTGSGAWQVTRAAAGPGYSGGWQESGLATSHPEGRWPANLIHDGSEAVEAVLGDRAKFYYCAKASKADREEGLEGFAEHESPNYDRSASGDFAKRMNRVRPPIIRRNTHPTVKPTELMRYLCRLITPAGGVILDPFTGSGSTGKAAKLEGFGFVGFEQDAGYVQIARARIEGAV